MTEKKFKNIKILFIMNNVESFISHRLHMVKLLKENGAEIHVCGPFSHKKNLLELEGFTFHEIPLNRGINYGIRELKLIWSLFCIYKAVNPQITYNITIKAVLYGTLIAQINKCSFIVNSINGIGYVFMNKSFSAKLMKKLIGCIYKNLFRKDRIKFIFQNNDDIEYFLQHSYVNKNNVAIVNGAGVDINVFKYESIPDDEYPIVLFSGRLLLDKGLGEFVDASRKIKQDNIKARFVMVGAIDVENPSGVSVEQIDKWVDEKLIEWWGFREDIFEVLRQSRLVCLPSYREGVPKSLLDAMSVGRPIVTTDAPGCRETVINGVNGYLVPTHDSHSLAEKIKILLLDKKLSDKMGIESRKYVERKFDQEIVSKAIMNACMM